MASVLAVAYPMGTPRPTAWPPHPLVQFFSSSSDPSLTRRGPLRVFDPADELIAGEWGDVAPCNERCSTHDEAQREVLRECVDGPARELRRRLMPRFRTHW